MTGVRTAPAISYRGEAFAPGDPLRGGTVTATYRAGLQEASVRLNDGSRYQVQPVSRTLPEAPVGLHAVMQTTPAGSASTTAPLAAGSPPLASLSTLRVVEIAIDADVEFFQLNGSSLDNTLADIESVMNGVSALWEAEVGARFEITTVIVSVAVSDTSLLQSVTAESRLDGGSFRQITLCYNGASERFEGSFSPSAPGQLVVTFRASDVHDHEAAPGQLVRTIYPAVGTAPSVSGLALSPDPVAAGQSLTISALVTDPRTVRYRQSPRRSSRTRHNWRRSRSPRVPEISSLAPSPAPPGLTAGGFSVEVTAEDMQGNVTTRSVPGSAYQAPLISSVTVSPSSFNATESYQVSAAVSHPVGVSWVKGAVSLNGGAYQEQSLAFDGGSLRYEGTFPPTGAGGTLTVRIRAASNDGHEATPAYAPVTVEYAPVTLADVTPDGGSIAGGTTIVILGSGFSGSPPGTTTVTVGGRAAAEVTVVDDQTVTALLPPSGVAGSVEAVRLTIPLGVATLPRAFTHLGTSLRERPRAFRAPIRSGCSMARAARHWDRWPASRPASDSVPCWRHASLPTRPLPGRCWSARHSPRPAASRQRVALTSSGSPPPA
ncbi:MAG: IPT/TIG domain-containing protein [Planctomycetota bacterium]